MRIGIVGLGKLGMPVALALSLEGHDVMGNDIDPRRMRKDSFPHREIGPNGEPSIEPLLRESSLRFGSLDEVVAHAEIVFVAVQTPHEPLYEGVTRLPEKRADFDYTFLKGAVADLSAAVERRGEDRIVIVISTVLPGTMRREILPLVGEHVKLCYNPFFIAMGTTIRDFLHPEFVLFGVRDPEAADKARELYATLHDRPLYETSIENAELIKVAYNTFITMKVCFANVLMEVSHKIEGCDVDEVSGALALATDRLLSPAYLRGGMGDGGGCFPPGEIVMTASGPRPIETVRQGDLVLTGDGSLQPVIRTWERHYDGELVTAKVRGLPECRMTSDHPVIAREDLRVRSATRRRRTDIFPLSDPHEVEAGALTDAHALTFPRPASYVPLPPHATDEYLELAGWWLSEGSAELSERRGRLRFDLHVLEEREAVRVGELLVACAPARPTGRGGNATLSHEVVENRRAVRFGSMALTKQLVSDFGKGAARKKLPPWALWADERSAALILSGMVKGDGHVSRQGIHFATISRDLAWGAFVLMTTLGCVPTLREIPARPGHQRSYEVRVRNRREARELAAKIGVACDARGAHEVRSEPWRPVRRLRSEQYSGPVHNLWVAGTNTFVAACGVVHNCHPRDNIALSWLARELDLSSDWFESIMLTRETQTDWLAGLVEEQHERRGFAHRRVGIYGRAFKAGTNLTVGSPAILLANLLEERGFEVEMWDPHVDEEPCPFDEPRVYFVATMHEEFARPDWQYPAGSVVIDPWRVVPDREGVEIVPVGVGRDGRIVDLVDELSARAGQNGRPAASDRAATLDPA